MPEIIFNGQVGRLEGRFIQNEHKDAPAALILHPHPVYGGTMNNKVIYNAYQTFANCGFSVLRFNFRGVGKSVGEFDHGIGELADAATALDLLQMQNPEASSYWICGFSFGAWVAMQLLMRRPELHKFVAISPPANKYDFSFLSPCPTSGLVIQGDQDSIVSEESVSGLVDRISSQRNIEVDYRIIFGGDHFFRGKLDDFNENLEDYLSDNMKIQLKKNAKIDKRRRQAVKPA